MSCEDVFDALIIKIATNTIPTTIPIKTSTMYHTIIQTGIKRLVFYLVLSCILNEIVTNSFCPTIRYNLGNTFFEIRNFFAKYDLFLFFLYVIKKYGFDFMPEVVYEI
jgi:hypothetical protein